MGLKWDGLKIENMEKYAMIIYNVNINSSLSENLHNAVYKDDSWVKNGK